MATAAGGTPRAAVVSDANACAAGDVRGRDRFLVAAEPLAVAPDVSADRMNNPAPNVEFIMLFNDREPTLNRLRVTVQSHFDALDGASKIHESAESLSAEKNSSSGKEALTGEGASEDIGGIPAQRC